VDGRCANAVLGATASGSAAPSLAGCNELGTYEVNAAGTTLTLSPISGTPRVLPFRSVLAGESYGPTSESLRAGGGLHVLGTGSGYYYPDDASPTGSGSGYYGVDSDSGYYGAEASTAEAGGGDGGVDGAVGDDAGGEDAGGGDASPSSDGGAGSAQDGGSGGESADGGSEPVDRTAALSCPGGTPAHGGAPLTHAFTAGSQSLVGGGAPSGIPDPTQGGQWSCSGSFDPSVSNAYYLTSFGCSSSNPAFLDSSDNCCGAGAPVAAAARLCGSLQPASSCSNSCANNNSGNGWRSQQTGAIAASFQCEEMINCYCTGAVAYCLGTRLRLSTPAGKGLVVFVCDDGPSCTIERKVGAHVLDVSPPTAESLLGESQISATERKAVFVTEVGASTPLGPDDGCESAAGGGAGTGDAGSSASSGGSTSDAGCASATSCGSDSDCNPAGNGSGMICSGGTCVPWCRASWQCPGNTMCQGGQCS
jgi:hypothetical protein